jgi:hypothetical protein
MCWGVSPVITIVAGDGAKAPAEFTSGSWLQYHYPDVAVSEAVAARVRAHIACAFAFKTGDNQAEILDVLRRQFREFATDFRAVIRDKPAHQAVFDRHPIGSVEIMTATLPPAGEASVAHGIVPGSEKICGITSQGKLLAATTRPDAEQAEGFPQVGHVALEAGQDFARIILDLVGHSVLLRRT